MSSLSPDFTGWTLLSQGAEARVWRKDHTVCKERFPKTYRHVDLDRRLTKSRNRAEARLLEKCRSHNIPVPNVHSNNDHCIYMDYIEGSAVRQHLANLSGEELETVAQEMGKLVATLHNAGMIHGDLTTSNMMIRNGIIHLIDFGLAKSNTSSEERAVDLYVLERAIASTHPQLPETFIQTLFRQYQDVIERPAKKNQQTVLNRLEQVRQRGRKRDCFG